MFATIMLTDEYLRRDVRMLADVLGGVIRKLKGESAFLLVEDVRKLARGRRDGDSASESLLFARMQSLDLDDVAVLIRAFSIFFDMANLAEDRHRARVLRERRQNDPEAPPSESIAAAMQLLRDRQTSEHDLNRLLNDLRIEMVFTAHPSEAKRRTVRQKVRVVREALAELDGDLLPIERQQVRGRIEAAIVGLWQSDFLRPRPPTVLEEVRRGLSFAGTLWTVGPKIVADLRRAVDHCFPDRRTGSPAFLKFGSWIGGDRDGHPFVTAEVTLQTLHWLRETALEHHAKRALQLHTELSMSARAVRIDPIIEARIEEAMHQWPELDAVLEPVSPFESYRRLLSVVHWRLEQTRDKGHGQQKSFAGAYRSAGELEGDLTIAADSLRANGGQSIADASLQEWIDQVRTFGLHFAKLDIRQESSYYTAVLTDLFKRLGVADHYADLDEAGRQRMLSEPADGFPDLSGAEDETVETVALFRMLVRAVDQWGEEVLGGHVVSMTHSVSDLLAVYWLWRTSLNESRYRDSADRPRLAVIPLFETIDDLTRAQQTLADSLNHPVYSRLVQELGGEQVVMVGYSDSTKDGGYLAATWALFQAEARMAETAAASKVRLILFHGRGGALGRGGGPAARGIRSLPPAAVQGALRMTEQGEVLAERYDDPAIAHRHLEQVTWATLLVSALPTSALRSEWLEAIEHSARMARAAYRRLVDEPGFMDFFRAATPISEIEQLSIGSRPSRRKDKLALADLRAIPWVFAWTQNRLLIPAWYGLGSGLGSYAEEFGWPRLQEMYVDWPYFRATIDNAALALAKADLAIAHEYAGLVEDAKLRERLWSKIQAEYAASRSTVVRIKGTADLLADVPWFETAMKRRNPYVDPLNLLQVELFRRLRVAQSEQSEKEIERLRQLLRLAVTGIASGMRTTG